ncbi:MAG: dephospho-CoA kinase [Nitrospirae bacterium]|nr:dephospho-CoA kinase [Magnetococcales bacterium]
MPGIWEKADGNMSTRYPLFLVGLTGSMGCGKSTVGRLFAGMGAWVIDTDLLARQVVAPGSPGLNAVVARFGDSFLESGEGMEKGAKQPGLDRKKMAAWIFSHPQERVALETMLHAWILQAARDALLQGLDHRLQRENGPAAIAILEVPLLFEVGWDPLCDRTVNVVCGQQQWQRLALRDTMSDEVKRQVMARQLSEEEKKIRAHHTIDNSGSSQSTITQVTRLWSEFQILAHRHRRPLWSDVGHCDCTKLGKNSGSA